MFDVMMQVVGLLIVVFIFLVLVLVAANALKRIRFLREVLPVTVGGIAGFTSWLGLTTVLHAYTPRNALGEVGKAFTPLIACMVSFLVLEHLTYKALKALKAREQ